MLEQHLKNYNHMFYKHVMNVISLYILVFAISISSYAQNPDLRFKTVEYGENFPQSTISSIVQSKKGFIWLGTDNGLVRYDGYEFLRYYTQNKEEGTISNNIVTCIYEDAEENLWVGTNHGVNLYNKKADNFTGVDISSVKGGPNYISSFVEDDEGNLWVGTFGGVRKINKKNLLLEGGTNDSSTAFNNKVFALLYDPAFGVLVSTHLGLQCFNPRTGLEIELPALLKNHPTFLKEKVLKIIKDDCGDLWFATESGGVFWFSKNEYQLINYKHIFNNANSISTNNIKDIVSVDTNTIWFATDNGLNVFKKDSKKFKVYEHSPILSTSISDNNITSLLKDREGSIWLGTKTGSIDFYNESNLNFINIKESVNQNFGLNNTIVNALVSDYNGALWAGTNGGGLNYLDFKTHKNQSYLIGDFKGNNIIKALVHKDENTLLCGTLFGLYQFDKRSNRFSKIPISGTEVQVSSIAVDNDDIWVGTDGNGLIHISKNGAIKTYRKGDSESSISDNFILHIENRDNGLWVSTQFGLNFFNKNTKAFTSFFKTAQNHSLPNNTLTALYSDSKNRLWIGLGYGGLSYFDTKNKKFYLINESLGLTDGAIKSIAEDNQGNLWVSSNNLLFKITIKQFELPFKASNFEITSYGSSDGIAVKNYVLNSSAILGDALAFGGAEGLVLFNPNKILKPKVKNKVVLTKLIVNNQAVKFSPNNTILDKDISEASEIALNHNQKFIGLQFSSLNFINTENNTYAYKLEGAFEEEDWQNIGTQNSINLAALNSGTYTFKVKPLYAGNAGDIDTIKSLKINILSPWWQTYWAYALYMVLLLLVFLIIIKFIKSKVVIKQALLLKQSESERQRELYNMKLDFFTNISHEIRTPLTLIQGPVEELLEACEKDGRLEKKLTTIKKNSDRLLTLINELLDFRKIESKQAKLYCEEQDIVQFCFDIYESFKGVAAKKNIGYKFVMNTKVIPVFFDKNQMEKVIYNLLSNAFKFTKKNGKIVISIEDVSDDTSGVTIKIKDNGIGIPKNSKNNVFKGFFQVDERGHKNAGSGIGLALSKAIIELHKGKLSIENETETWANTIFKIDLQKGKDHLEPSEILKKSITLDEMNSGLEDSGTDERSLEHVLQIEELEIDQDTEEQSKPSVFVIDDHKDIRKFITDILKEEYHITTFTNGRDALHYMEEQIPDLIICDVMMPEMDGFEFCNHIKTNEATNHIPVILLTAKTSTENRIEGLSLGADAYLTKPFSVKVLKLNMINLLSSKEILRQKYSGSFIIDSKLDKLDVPEEVFLKKLMTIIEENIEKPDFDVNELIKEIGMSRSVLYKKVKALTNHSVASLIKHIRLKKAADILENTNYHISQVTFMIGFNDRKHFSREFKKVFKVSPSEYKKNKKTK